MEWETTLRLSILLTSPYRAVFSPHLRPLKSCVQVSPGLLHHDNLSGSISRKHRQEGLIGEVLVVVVVVVVVVLVVCRGRGAGVAVTSPCFGSSGVGSSEQCRPLFFPVASWICFPFHPPALSLHPSTLLAAPSPSILSVPPSARLPS
ncbi:hypothetical protein E2C01_028973 [Portunus trituberculatus]|uniref:Uncharacterized protein n=1 Tax=Portunus trituberculatus TaxID=210409 RepID=A0A5B7EQJ3_PORTR|nr:hypothetical protein [Portunus trituberculatus]